MTEFPCVTFGKHVAEISVKAVQVFFLDGQFMFNSLFESVRFVLLQNSVENAVAFLTWRLKDVERPPHIHCDVTTDGCRS